jgi:hypothetical protein
LSAVAARRWTVLTIKGFSKTPRMYQGHATALGSGGPIVRIPSQQAFSQGVLPKNILQTWLFLARLLAWLPWLFAWLHSCLLGRLAEGLPWWLVWLLNAGRHRSIRSKYLRRGRTAASIVVQHVVFGFQIVSRVLLSETAVCPCFVPCFAPAFMARRCTREAVEVQELILAFV